MAWSNRSGQIGLVNPARSNALGHSQPILSGRRAQGFIDGDLIESFLDLRRETMEEVARLVGGTTVEELSKRIEELQRLH